ncbi:GNAT family N-acetyltransferase [bacterium]|nr:MAG: GNAT family N-acetyltransferase [bacterium]
MAQLVRRWTLDDLTLIQDVLWKTWLDSYSHFIPEEDLKSYFSEHYDLDSLRTLFHNPLADGFVALDDDKLAGFMRTARDTEENRYYVSSIYVLPQFQGKKIGKALMERAGQEAKAFKLDRIWIGVMVQNTQAVDWYKSMGYEVVRTEPFTMGKLTVDHYIGFVKIDSIR